jgi:ribonuclease HII
VDEPDRAIDHNERLLHEQGFSLVAGVDEAGRGALAGPLVAGAVILPAGFDCEGLRDSKELTPQQRDEWFERIDRDAVAWAVRRAYPTRIDRKGLHKTNVWLLRQVVLALDIRPDFVLADGFRLRTLSMPQLAVKKGDVTCASVAAASVMAKVSRDRAMNRYARRFPQYGFERHKGYGTPTHRAAIARYGPSEIHRMSFKGMIMYREQHEAYVAKYDRPDLIDGAGMDEMSDVDEVTHT